MTRRMLRRLLRRETTATYRGKMLTLDPSALMSGADWNVLREILTRGLPENQNPREDGFARLMASMMVPPPNTESGGKP